MIERRKNKVQESKARTIQNENDCDGKCQDQVKIKVLNQRRLQYPMCRKKAAACRSIEDKSACSVQSASS